MVNVANLYANVFLIPCFMMPIISLATAGRRATRSRQLFINLLLSRPSLKSVTLPSALSFFAIGGACQDSRLQQEFL